MIAAVMMIGTAAAQEQQQNGQKREKPTAEQMAKFSTERMTKALELNDEQQKQMYDYNLKRINDAQKKAEAARREMEAARKSNAEQMQKILTPDQYQKWSEMQKKRAEMGRAQGQRGGWQGRGPQAGQAHRNGQHGPKGPAPKHHGKDKKADGRKDCCKDGKQCKKSEKKAEQK